MCGGTMNFVWNLDKRGIVLMSPTTGGGWEEEAQGIMRLGDDQQALKVLTRLKRRVSRQFRSSVRTDAVREAVENRLSTLQSTARRA